MLIIAWLIIGAANGIIRELIQISGRTVSSVTRTTSKRNRRYSQGLKKVEDNKEVAKKTVEEILVSIEKKTRDAKNFISGLAQHFFAQAIDTGEQEQKDEAEVKSIIVNKNDVEPSDRPVIFPRYAGQKILGAMLELAALLIFLYADAAQTANTISGLFPGTPVPDWLTNITIPLIAASAGAVFLLGMFIGDLIGATHLTNLTQAGRLPKWVLTILMITTLVLTITLSTYSALYRVPVMEHTLATDAGKLIATRATVAQSLTIIPLLITTFLLFRGVLGVFVILGLITYGFVLPFAVLEYAIQILTKLISTGLVEVWVVLVRLLDFSLGALDLLLVLLSAVLQAALKIIALLITIILFIPYLIVNIPLKRATEQTVEQHLGEFLHLDFKSDDEDEEDEVIEVRPVSFLPPPSNL